MAKGKSTLYSSGADEDGSQLNRANLITAIQMLTAQLKRYNDSQQVVEPKRGEAEFGKATYTNREQREQTEQLHAQLDPPLSAKTRPSKHRPG